MMRASCRAPKSPLARLVAGARLRVGGGVLALLLALGGLLLAGPAAAATPPVIDGNLTDMVTFVNQVIAEKLGNGLTKTDPAKDVCKSDTDIYPCPAGLEEPCASDPVNRTYFKNGYDLTLAVAAYDRANQTIYLGVRAAGVIGDVDGDQTAGDGGCAPPPGKLDINDGNGIGNNETYIFNVDFDCGQNGVNELRIEVDNNQVYVNDVVIPAADWAFNGSDLEIKIPGQLLPEMWSISVKTGASEDGLEEETIQERTPAPPLDLTILKSADPTVICPNGTTLFTVAVTNPGAGTLAVNLLDQLPAQLSFVSMDPSSDFVLDPNPPANPQSLTFATLNIAPGETKYAKFVAQASAECLGAVENVATATGVFSSACLPAPGTATVGPVEARATVVCQSKPCISEVKCEVPATVCVGQNYTVTGSAKNCGDRPADLTVTLKDGAGAVLKTEKFVGVGAGATVTLTSDPIACAAPGVNNYSVEAFAENDCGASDLGTSQCSVTCKSLPCVSNVGCQVPTEVCVGQAYTVAGSAQNCGDRPASLTITIKDGSGAVIKTQVFENVPAGEPVILHSDEITCAAPGVNNYSVEATATNDCGTTEPATSNCSVTCKSLPCVSDVACDVPVSVCIGQSYTVKGSAKNCGDREADLTVTIKTLAGAVLKTEKFVGVAAGATVLLESDPIVCEAPGVHDYVIEAIAENDCGATSPATSQCSVECKSQPCLSDVKCEVPAEVCVGQSYTVKGSAKNCDTRAANLTITIKDGTGAVIKTQLFENVPAGEIPVLETGPITCAAPGLNQYTIEAQSENDCGTSDLLSSQCSVTCKSLPCVSDVACQVPAEVCVGQSYKVTGSAKNCGDRPADVTVTIKTGAGAVLKTEKFVGVAAGAIVTLESDLITCAAPGVNEYVIEGKAENDCGATDVLTSNCSVTCKELPCISEVACEVPAEVCVGLNYTVKGSAKNCGATAADITITIKTGAGAVLKTEKFVGVAAGAKVTLESEPITCAAPGVNNYVIEAQAENSCGATDLVTSNCSVTCKDVAKLSVLCMVSETEAKDGDLITVTGKATNTSTAVEDITIQVLGPTGTVLCEQTFNGVAPGAEVSLPCQVTVECEPDQTISYKVVAVATNDCGQERKETSESCSVYCPPQGTNCPRTVGFWGQQCAQKTGGSTKFTKDEVTRIAACIDAESDAFSWSSPFDGFCANINPPRPMDCKKQAHRQFAALLANYCTGKLALIANNGNEISLDPSSPNPCKSSFPDAKNLGELIAAMDAKLAELDAMGAGGQDHGYCMVSECADGINNGRGIVIDPACAEEYSSSRTSGGMELGTSGGGDDQVSAPALELYRPTPNPFTNSTTVAYAVGGNGQDVQIGIYDVAGRLVRTLASGFQAAGRYEVKWNGRSDNGTEVTHGVYFIRALVGGERVNDASRILYVR